ncbi:MAG: pitrilysin family protein [bacterium]
MKIQKKVIKIIVVTLVVLLQITITYALELESKVGKEVLPNGLKIIMLERHDVPTVSLYIRFKVGMADEPSGRTGTAHLTEHMLFKGTTTLGTSDFKTESKILEKIKEVGRELDLEKLKGKKTDQEKINKLTTQLKALEEEEKRYIIKDEIDSIYTKNGADGFNATTGSDITSYFINLPANKVELWARIESDRIMNPVFREFYTERDVVYEERNQTYESNPFRKLLEQFLATAFMVHPYRNPVIGWGSELKYLDMNETMNFFRTYYAPNNMVIAAVGDFKQEELLTLIKKYFGPFKRGNALPISVTKEPDQLGERRVSLEFEAEPRLIMGYHKPTLPEDDDYVFDLIDGILSSGRTSRLYKRLVEEEKIVATVQTSNGWPGARFDNLFVIFATPLYPHTATEVEGIIEEELNKLKEKPVPVKELEKIKNQYKADFIRGLASDSGMASQLSYYEIVSGDWRYMVNFLEAIEKITPDDIMKVANKYFTNSNKTVAELIKKAEDKKARRQEKTD